MSVPAEKINTRTARKATIKRASAQARISLRRIDRRALERLTDLYENTRDDLRELILSAGDNTGAVRLNRLQELLDQTNVRLRQLETARNDLFGEELLEAATSGIHPFASIATGSTAFNRIPEQAVRFVQSFVGDDGLQLSDRVWRIDRGARDAVSNAIERSVILGHSASEAARDFLANGEPVPADVQAKMGDAAAAGIATAAGRALMQNEGNAYQNSLRLFRTELNRAHNEAYAASAFESDDVVGMKFTLSPNHPRVDICDMHANANVYGLGKGVYPKDKHPYPAHPNTFSFLVAVFADEVTDADRKGKEDRISWLKRQSPGIQQEVLGSSKKRAALEKGLLKENQITTPWKVLKQRYMRQGIDIDDLVATVAEPVGAASGRIPRTYIPSGSPVSGAFEARNYAKVTERVLGAIDSVHGDGRLPVIPIISSPSNAGYYGAYRVSISGEALDIRIKAGGDHKELTLAHEIGHFLDDQGAPGKGFSSIGNRKFEAWRRAVDNTPEIRHLRSLESGPDAIKLPSGEMVLPKSYIRYLLTYHEIWARSYAQYIAVRSRNQVIMNQVDDVRRRTTGGDLPLPNQWQDDNFLPIAKEMDKLMEDLGWMKK